MKWKCDTCSAALVKVIAGKNVIDLEDCNFESLDIFLPLHMASNFRHLAGCKDGYRYFLLLRKSGRQPDRPLAAERPNTGSRCGLTDRRSSVKKLLSFVCLLMFPSLLEGITGARMPVECSKQTCFAKVKIRHGSQSSEIDDRSCPLPVTVRVLGCEAEFDLGKGKKRSKATYPHWKDEGNITIIDTRIRIHTSTSLESRVKVKSTFGGPPLCLDPARQWW